MKRLAHWLLAFGFLYGTSAQATEAQRCELITLADVGWTDITMTTAVARLVLTDLGYRTQVKRLSLPDTYQSLADGQVDVFLGNWMPAQTQLLDPHLKTGRIEKLQTNLPTVRYTLAVLEPAYNAGLHDFADIHRFKDQLRGQIFGIEPGNEGNGMVKTMIKENVFGLGDFTLVESSEKGMLNHVERAQQMGRPAVFLGWEPHPMNDKLRMFYLSGGDKYFGPNYGAAQVNTVARGGFAEECPNVAQLFRNLTFTIAAENQLMSGVLEGNTNRRRVAKQWIENNPELVNGWIQGISKRQ